MGAFAETFPEMKPQPGTKVTVENQKCYLAPGKEAVVHRTVTYTVEAILDCVPGAWHEPEDLANWMSEHSYVRSVSYKQPHPQGTRTMPYETASACDLRKRLAAKGISQHETEAFFECLSVLEREGFFLSLEE